ncbi:Crp/Fnr family transcriptional regulator [Dysgonomonas macrotermitis]|uniref:cAMP-binding domain of CRP or a regulatory subunit of cAMP-dependent protein kinases n=1 Tax=Dysgonomonas macrotermitis TaxID=1346286 RepID=A0A1M5BMA2_9BACT|nr:Crp/Fnr family transcriptional regulator [Dysgonomonas macrotermitis]SHF43743.1 cAMP-binding domain of CRP or a regulatory subunit of cAMP-dependent protein kinases [Dysgonomonas macrotermitis]
MDINTAILSIYTISENSINELLKYCYGPIEKPKGYILTKAGTIEEYLYFVTKGIVRTFSIVKDEEVTFWIGEEGSVACSMRNYVESKPSYETIETLEDCSLYRIKAQDLQQLYKQNIEIANWGRKFAEYEIMKTENRLIAQQFLTAKERYDNLIKSQPQLLQRIPLSIIASYLGITQVSLSRIRALK